MTNSNDLLNEIKLMKNGDIRLFYKDILLDRDRRLDIRRFCGEEEVDSQKNRSNQEKAEKTHRVNSKQEACKDFKFFILNKKGRISDTESIKINRSRQSKRQKD